MSAVAPPAAGAPGEPEAARLASTAAPAAMTAAVTAAPATPAAAATAVARCANCGAALSGRYCAQCGQRVEPPVHSLWHFGKVATEDLTHADSRLWRTLAALLFKPGRLTAEFLAGRRARYLPPVRLYLVLSVAFFVWLSTGRTVVLVVPGTTPHAVVQSARSGKVATPFSRVLPGETEEQRTTRLCSDARYEGPWQDRIGPLVPQMCRRIVADNGRALAESFMHNLPRAMFLFLPLLAAGMMLLYWWPRHYYVEHLLMLVHAHAFVFLALMLTWAVTALLPLGAGLARFAAFLYIPWYMYRSMRVVYGQGRWLTAAKLVTVFFFYLVSGALMVVLTSVYSALTL